MDQVQDRVIALTSLNHHLLTPSLVSPSQLQTALEGIEKELLRNYAPFKFGFDSLDYFYSVPSTTYLADDNYLYVEINIPLSVISAHYHIYEVHTVPLSAGKSTSQYTEIVGLDKYLGVSVHGDTYVTFDDKFLTSCSGVGIQRCDTRMMETSILVPSCILGLFLNDRNMTAAHCHTDLILTPSLPETAIDIGQGSFFISAMDVSSDWVISCPDRKPRTILACRSCVVTLDCRCNLKTPSGFISASLTGCSNSTSTSGIVKNYVPNMVWIQSLSDFSARNYSHLLNASLLPYDPIGKIPDLPIPDFAQVAAYADQDARIRTDLATVLQQAKTQQPVYVSKLQELTDDTVVIQLRKNHAFPLAIVAIIWEIFLTITLVFLFRQYFIIFTLLRKYGAACPTGVPSTPNPAIEYCLWYISTLLTIYVVVTLVIFLCRRRRKYLVANDHYPLDQHDQLATDVYLKFFSGLRLAIIHLDHIYAPQDTLQYDYDTKYVTDPELKDPPTIIVSPKYAWFTMKIELEWIGGILFHTPTKLKIPLPSEALISRSVQNTLYAILRDKYQVSLLLRTGPDQKELPLNVILPMRHLPQEIDRLHAVTKPIPVKRKHSPKMRHHPYRSPNFPRPRSSRRSDASHPDTVVPVTPDPADLATSPSIPSITASPPPKRPRPYAPFPLMYPNLENMIPPEDHDFQPVNMDDVD